MRKSKPSRRKRYSAEERAKILATAKAQNLIGDQVAKKFGISAITFYLWRKKAGSTESFGSSTSTARLRQAVRARLARQLPRIIDQEIAQYLKEVFRKA